MLPSAITWRVSTVMTMLAASAGSLPTSNSKTLSGCRWCGRVGLNLLARQDVVDLAVTNTDQPGATEPRLRGSVSSLEEHGAGPTSLHAIQKRNVHQGHEALHVLEELLASGRTHGIISHNGGREQSPSQGQPLLLIHLPEKLLQLREHGHHVGQATRSLRKALLAGTGSGQLSPQARFCVEAHFGSSPQQAVQESPGWFIPDRNGNGTVESLKVRSISQNRCVQVHELASRRFVLKQPALVEPVIEELTKLLRAVPRQQVTDERPASGAVGDIEAGEDQLLR